MCYILAPQMRLDIMDGAKDKLQSTSAYMRDGSVPMVQPLEGQGEADVPHTEAPVDRSYAHINEPLAGVKLQQSFLFNFIDPTAFDKPARVLLRGVENGHEVILLDKVEMDGNNIKMRVERPADLKAGAYDFVVQLADKDGAFYDRSSNRLEIEAA